VLKAIELLTKYLKAGISYRGIQRVESLPVPEAALREAVLNAILHKDYSSGTPVQISVYANKLMLWNHHLRRRGPNRAPSPAVVAIPSVYQVRTKMAETSGQ
jgi:predicted HTH transcriptional regulator